MNANFGNVTVKKTNNMGNAKFNRFAGFYIRGGVNGVQGYWL